MALADRLFAGTGGAGIEAKEMFSLGSCFLSELPLGRAIEDELGDSGVGLLTGEGLEGEGLEGEGKLQTGSDAV